MNHVSGPTPGETVFGQMEIDGLSHDFKNTFPPIGYAKDEAGTRFAPLPTRAWSS
jgi:hypothetical protein